TDVASHRDPDPVFLRLVGEEIEKCRAMSFREGKARRFDRRRARRRGGRRARGRRLARLHARGARRGGRRGGGGRGDRLAVVAREREEREEEGGTVTGAEDHASRLLRVNSEVRAAAA